VGVLRIQDFGGVVPVKGDRAIPDGYAVESVNTWLYGSELRGVRPPIHMEDLQPSTRKVLRIPKRTPGGDPTYPGIVPPPSYLGDSVWKQFDDPYTDIVRGQLVKDQYERYYFCSPSRGPEFNTYARMASGLANYKLGVPGPNIVITPGASPDNPDRPIIGTPTGGTGTIETRSYVYTWINEFGEESAPSLPATAAGLPNATWPISNIKDPPVVAGYPAYAKKRLYRTVTGSGGGFDYYKIIDLNIGTTTFSDVGTTYSNTTIVNNVTLESTSWALPPANLQGWIAMPNGFLIGFDKPDANNAGGNTIYMSEAYHFHAWPEAYQYATETPIVGLGVLGQTCVVCTQGFPATVTGIKPSTCAFTKATTGEPCMSRGGIVSSPQGVVYPSQNGLIMIGPNGIDNVTDTLMTREEWIRNYSPQYLRAVRYQNGYLALRMPPLPSPRSGFFLDPSALKVALTEFSNLNDMINVNVDFWSGEVFLLRTGVELLHWDPPFKIDNVTKNDELMPVRWLSKEFQYPFKENFGCYSIYWDATRYSDDSWGDPTVMPADEVVRFRVYADRRKVYDQEVPRNGSPVRLPSGFKSDIWQFEILARAPVYSLHVASSIKELKSV
jgi:hypothetical protein